MSGEVLTDLHTEESKCKTVFSDSMGIHAKHLELGSGGIQSIHCSTKNLLEHSLLPLYLALDLLALGRELLMHLWPQGAP